MLSVHLFLALVLVPSTPDPSPLESGAESWAAQPAEDVDGALSALSSDSAEQRRLAERWLAVHLSRQDFASVAAAAAGASPEVRGRLAGALSSDRNLSLAALLATEDGAELRRLGDEALRRALARWYGPDPPAPAQPADLSIFLRDFASLHSLRPLSASPHTLLDRLARLVDGRPEERPEADAVALIVAPGIPDREPGRGAGATATGAVTAEGVFGELAYTVARAHGARLRAFGLEGRRPMLLVEPAGRSEPPLFDQAVDWVRAVEGAGPHAGVAARALAAMRWPAALLWLAERWSRTGDPAALQGLVLAAGQGRVAPHLARPAALRTLAAELVQADAEWGDELLRALIALGGIGSGGEDLSAVLTEAFRGQRPARVARIAHARILAAWGRAPEPVRAEWRGWLAGSGTPAPAVRLAALHALAATAAAPEQDLVLAQEEALLLEARAQGIVAPALAWLATLGADPPAAWFASDVPLGVRLALLSHELSLDPSATPLSGDRAPRLLAELARAGVGPERLSEVLARQRARSGADRTRQVLLASGLTELEQARLALLAGAALPGSGHELFVAHMSRPQREPVDYLVLGALVARFGDAEVEEGYGVALLESVRTHLARYGPGQPGMEAPWVAGCRRALEELRMQGEDDRAEKLLQALRRATRGTDHPLRRALRSPGGRPWPQPAALPLEEAFELRLG